MAKPKYSFGLKLLLKRVGIRLFAIPNMIFGEVGEIPWHARLATIPF